MYVLFVTQCSIQGHSQIYRVGEMLKVLVIPCDIQLPACFSVLKVESTCLCFVRICTVGSIDEAACLIVYMLVVCIDIE